MNRKVCLSNLFYPCSRPPGALHPIHLGGPRCPVFGGVPKTRRPRGFRFLKGIDATKTLYTLVELFGFLGEAGNNRSVEAGEIRGPPRFEHDGLRKGFSQQTLH